MGTIDILVLKDTKVTGEALEVFQMAREYRRGKKNLGTVMVQLPPEWIDEMMAHVALPSHRVQSKHNYFLVRVPVVESEVTREG